MYQREKVSCITPDNILDLKKQLSLVGRKSSFTAVPGVNDVNGKQLSRSSVISCHRYYFSPESQ